LVANSVKSAIVVDPQIVVHSGVGETAV